MVIASDCVGFTLPGMMEEPGSFSGKHQLAEAGARAGGEPANVVGDFHQRRGQSFQRAAGEDDFVVRGKRRKFVGMRSERQARELRNFLRGAFAEIRGAR